MVCCPVYSHRMLLLYSFLFLRMPRYVAGVRRMSVRKGKGGSQLLLNDYCSLYFYKKQYKSAKTRFLRIFIVDYIL